MVAAPDSPKHIGSLELLKVWLSIGAQSFGGGAVTLTLIRKTLIEDLSWVPAEKFDRDWALAQMTPGVNQIALTILLGKRLAGLRGSAIAVAGLVLPSAAITVVIAALYVHFRSSPLMGNAVKGIVPATIGIGLYTALDMLRHPLKTSRGLGPLDLSVALMLLVIAPVLAWRSLPVIAVLLSGGAVGALLFWLLSQNRKRRQPSQEGGS